MEVLPLKGKREFVEGNEFALNYPIIHKEKVRISRQKLLNTTKFLMEIYGHSKSTLEISYFGQEGIGKIKKIIYKKKITHKNYN